MSSRVEFHKLPSNSTLHAYSKGIIRAHRTHCGRFLCACLGAIRTALLEDTVANMKGKSGKGGTESALAHKWAGWLHNPCRLGGPQRLRVGDKFKSGPIKWAGWLHNPCHLGVPGASEHGTKLEVAHKWADWGCHPCHLGGPNALE